MTSLRILLRLNAASCLAFGMIFILMSGAVSGFLGDMPTGVVRIVGLGLIVNGLHLAVASRRTVIHPVEVVYFSLGDLVWWLGSLLLIANGSWITTSSGVIVTIFVACGISGLGIVQLWMLGLLANARTSAQHWRSITQSFRAMPMWIYIWMTFVNVAFLTSVFFWPDRMATVVLLGFVATGPLLAAQIAYDGGLRRILGLSHLVPWIPLLIWLIWHGADHIYMVILASFLAICLILDTYDLWRFWRGDRAVLGSHMSEYCEERPNVEHH